jgi:exosortase E/protease (VPEID-CTERM system)
MLAQASWNGNSQSRLYLAYIFIVILMIALGYLSVGVYPPFRELSGYGFALLGHTPSLVRFAVPVLLTALTLVIVRRVKGGDKELVVSNQLLLLLFGSGASLCAVVLLLRHGVLAQIQGPLAFGSLVLWSLFFITCAYLADKFIVAFASRRVWLSALVVGAMVLVGARLEESLAGFIHWALVMPTIFLVVGAVNVFFARDVMITQISEFFIKLDIDGFEIGMAQSCAGYNGALIAMGVCAVYMWVIRDRLIWPRALVVFPVLAVSMFLMNSVRIFVLLMIGKFVSPAIAVEGFHMYAGWIYLLTHTTAAIYWFETSRWVSRDPLLSFSWRKIFGPQNPDDLVLMVPLIVFLALSIVLGAFSTTMNWLYPFAVIIAGSVTLIYLPRLSLSAGGGELLTVATGILVSLIWFALVPEDAISSAETAVSLSTLPFWAVAIWLVFRFIGAVALIPVIEEMAFRGAVQPQLARLLGRSAGDGAGAIYSIIVTSLMFGFLHSAFLAGTVAGLFYGWLRYRTGTLLAPILAHAVTNFLISFYVLTTGAWSYW